VTSGPDDPEADSWIELAAYLRRLEDDGLILWPAEAARRVREMAASAVPSSGSTGPRDLSAQLHSNFTGPVPVPHITVRIYLSDMEAEKVTVADVTAAVDELLARLGVDQGQVEVSGAEGS
jgi:hypothetical protein